MILVWDCIIPFIVTFMRGFLPTKNCTIVSWLKICNVILQLHVCEICEVLMHSGFRFSCINAIPTVSHLLFILIVPVSKVNAGKSFILIKTRTTVIRILFVAAFTMVRVFASKKPFINVTTEASDPILKSNAHWSAEIAFQNQHSYGRDYQDRPEDIGRLITCRYYKSAAFLPNHRAE